MLDSLLATRVGELVWKYHRPRWLYRNWHDKLFSDIRDPVNHSLAENDPTWDTWFRGHAEMEDEDD